ncbi:MAG TPA: hypothetical protein VH105_22495 [Burkholderiales bacterium]|jgi:hypothetical protein|nr:hypothetical protein [Burkholderiales bacterium]
MNHSVLESTVEAEKAVEHLLTPVQRRAVQRDRQRRLARLLLLDVAESGSTGLELRQGPYELIVRPTGPENGSAPDA